MAAGEIKLLHGSNATFWGDKSIVNSIVDSTAHSCQAAGMPAAHRRSRIAVPMHPQARRILDAFFRPHNEQLAALLGDEKWTWQDCHTNMSD